MPKQILLVDDSVTIQRVVALTFAHEADYTVMAAKSADDGLQKARDSKPDIVLADAGMMGKTGYDLCAALRADGQLASVPCLILTGNFSPYDEVRGQKAGADGYVVKPFESQALIDKVADAINKKGARAGAPVAAAPSPAPAPSPARKDDSLEISIEGGTTPRPAQVPAASVAPLPAPAAARPPSMPAPMTPPPARPPTSLPAARTMMGIPAPTMPVPPSAPKPPAPASVVEPLSKPLSMVAQETPAARAPASAASMPQAVPQMPRPPMIPGVPMPAPAGRHAESSKMAPPRSTLMGIPTVNPSNLPPGTVPLPPHLAMGATKPAAPWAPPPPPSAPSPSVSPSSHAPSLVSAVAERAVAEVSARGPEYEAVAQMSREIIERIAWEVVPELAETIIREQLDRLVAERQK